MQAYGSFYSHRPFAALRHTFIYRDAQLLWVKPLVAPATFFLPQSSLVLHFCPFVPRQVSLGRQVAGLIVGLHQNARCFHQNLLF